MYGVIVTLMIILSILLILVVLAQNPKGGGISSQFGGSGATQFIGVKKTGDLLEKITWGFAIALLVLSIGTNFFVPADTNQNLVSPNIENAQNSNYPIAPSPTISPSDNEVDLRDLVESDLLNQEQDSSAN